MKYKNLVAGINEKVPLSQGGFAKCINFDNAATTPPFISVLNEINNFAPWYSSIHRGAGYKSKISSNYYECARNIILDFVGGSKDKDTVIFVKNTTEAINKLSNRFCDDKKNTVVLSTWMEHHSNDLPWRNKYIVDYIDMDQQGKLSINDVKKKLDKYKGKVKLIAVTGASNVTGYINPVHHIAKLAHKYGAKILVDGAQLIPHDSFNMKSHDSLEHIDFLAFSAHKMYAPFGIGVLICPKKIIEKGAPDYSGGGTVDVVTHNIVKWAEAPHKDEAGTPNIMGVVALVAAIKTLKSIGMDNIYNHESKLLSYGINRLKEVPNIEIYCDSNLNSRQIATIPFNIKGLHHEYIANILSKEAGISVRNGCFCAQPYIQRLLNIDEKNAENYIGDSHETRPGMIRISMGLYNEHREIDILVNKLKEIAYNNLS